MDFLIPLLLSIVSGILAGMGMGGGTLLIPMLTLILDVEQEIAQAINLLVFVPSGVVCTIIYAKDKLIDFKKGGWIIAGASVVTVIASIIAVKIGGKILKQIFGVFIAGLGLVQLVVFIVKKINLKKQEKSKNSN